MSGIKDFEFFLPTRIVYGVGSRRKLKDQLEKLAAQNVLVVTDKSLIQAGVVEKVTAVLDGCPGVSYQVYGEVTENPVDGVVDGGYELAKQLGVQAVIGIGGGSCLDTATGIAMLMTNGGRTLDYFKGKPVSNPSLTAILIPTTAGTGSEVNRCFVVTDPSCNFKDGIADDLMCPTITILDPEMTLTMPQRVTAFSGVDALTHAFEAYLSRNAHPLSDALNLHAIRLISKYIRRAYADPTDLEARSGMLLASAIAGVGFDQVGLVLAHAMAHPLSGLFNVPHGVSCAVVIPVVLEFDIIAAPERIAEVGRILGAQVHPGMSVYDQAQCGVDAFRRLMADLQLPMTISELGVTEQDIPKLTQDAFAAKGMRSRNPRINSQKDIEALYRKLL